MRPEFTNKEDEIARKTSERIAEQVGNIAGEVGSIVDEKLKPIQEKIDSINVPAKPDVAVPDTQKEKPDNAKLKIRKIIEDARRAKADKDMSITDMSVEKSDVKTEGREHSHEFDCPTCHEHSMKIGPNSLTAKCTGPDCGKEFVLVDKSSDYKCVNCGIPIKKPAEGENMPDGCPFCGSNKAKQFDWNLAKKQ